MTTKEKAEELALKGLSLMSENSGDFVPVNKFTLLNYFPIAELLAVAEAAEVLYLETCDYININHIGDIHNNQSMQNMRDSLASLKSKLPSEVEP